VFGRKLTPLYSHLLNTTEMTHLKTVHSLTSDTRHCEMHTCGNSLGPDSIILTLHVWNNVNKWESQKNVQDFDEKNIKGWNVCCTMKFSYFFGGKSFLSWKCITRANDIYLLYSKILVLNYYVCCRKTSWAVLS